MESQPQNPEFRINPENFHPCTTIVFTASKISNGACWGSSNGKSEWIEDRSLIVSDNFFDFTFTAAETSHYQAFS